jgi:hypothetical protein
VIATPLDPWVHDLTQTSRSTDLWPLLLVLVLLLWPLDIALRRVSIGRREFAAAGAWVRAIPRRRRATPARSAAGEGLFAARERATSAGARAAMRRPDGVATDGVDPTTAVGGPAVAVAPVVSPAHPHRPAASAPAVPSAGAPLAASPSAAPATPAPAAPAEGPDTIARLRDAKRRARER